MAGILDGTDELIVAKAMLWKVTAPMTLIYIICVSQNS